MTADLLKEAGLKATRSRQRVLELLHEPQTCCLSAKSIYDMLLGQGENVSFATIYRTLDQLEEAGLVVAHNFTGEQKEFGLAKRADHDHMLCVDSGRVIKFEDAELKRLQQDIAARYGYEVVPNSLRFRVRPVGSQEQ